MMSNDRKAIGDSKSCMGLRHTIGVMGEGRYEYERRQMGLNKEKNRKGATSFEAQRRGE